MHTKYDDIYTQNPQYDFVKLNEEKDILTLWGVYQEIATDNFHLLVSPSNDRAEGGCGWKP